MTWFSFVEWISRNNQVFPQKLFDRRGTQEPQVISLPLLDPLVLDLAFDELNPGQLNPRSEYQGLQIYAEPLVLQSPWTESRSRSFDELWLMQRLQEGPWVLGPRSSDLAAVHYCRDGVLTSH